MSYTKLFQSILCSSIWNEDDQTRIVWISMLALANQHGEVEASIPGLARLAGVPVEACEVAIDKLSSPDKYSKTPDLEGRRITAIEGGWHIINHGKYREKASREDQKKKTAARVRRHREKAAQCNADVTPCNAPVTPCNDGVTQPVHIAEAEADTKKKKSPPKPPVGVLPFDSDAFKDAWNDWEQHRKEKRKTLTPTTKKKQLAKLGTLTEGDAIAMLIHSTTQGYEGLYAPKNNNTQQANVPAGQFKTPSGRIVNLQP
jgi:hypothetical protein